MWDPPSVIDAHSTATPCQLVGRLLFPVGPNIDFVPTATALGADDPAFEVRDLRFDRIAPDFNQRSVPAGVIQARRDQPLRNPDRLREKALIELGIAPEKSS
jgi:hypothetical protein